MEQIIYIVALIVYGIFIIRFILSWIGGDFDLDGDFDLNVSDIVSFKGLTHFLMGASGWLSVKQYTTHFIGWYDYLIAFCIGIIFVYLCLNYDCSSLCLKELLSLSLSFIFSFLPYQSDRIKRKRSSLTQCL